MQQLNQDSKQEAEHLEMEPTLAPLHTINSIYTFTMFQGIVKSLISPKV